MTRSQVEHVIRVAGMISDDDDIVVIGSQSILGSFPDAPGELLVSRAADVYPRTYRERAELIDGSIGEGSPFEQAYGYYADGVGPETTILPTGWQERLVVVFGPNTRFVRGWCLEAHDLAIAKLVAGREKDLDYVGVMRRYEMVSGEVLEARLGVTPMEPVVRALVAGRIGRLFGHLNRRGRPDVFADVRSQLLKVFQVPRVKELGTAFEKALADDCIVDSAAGSATFGG